MLGILGGDARCPIARSLDVLGEKWTLMVVRDALAGATRFSEFQTSLGLPRDVLADRLDTLVQADVLTRRPYKPESGRTRDEYVLTPAGRRCPGRRRARGRRTGLASLREPVQQLTVAVDEAPDDP